MWIMEFVERKTINFKKFLFLYLVKENQFDLVKENQIVWQLIESILYFLQDRIRGSELWNSDRWMCLQAINLP